MYANSQLSKLKKNELAPGSVAYGNEGVVEGDGSIYNHIDIAAVISNRTKTPAYADGLYAITDRDLHLKGLIHAPTYAGLEYYKHAVCLKDTHYRNLNEIITIAGTQYTYFTYNYIIIFDRNAASSKIYVFDKELNLLHQEAFAVSSNLGMSCVKESEDGNRLYMAYQTTTSGETMIRTIDFTNNTSVAAKLEVGCNIADIIEYNNIPHVVGSYLSGHSGYSIGVYENAKLLVYVDNAGLDNSYYSALKVGDLLYLSVIAEGSSSSGYRQEQVIHIYNLVTKEMTNVSINCGRGYLVPGKIHSGDTETDAAFVISGYNGWIRFVQEIQLTGATDLITDIVAGTFQLDRECYVYKDADVNDTLFVHSSGEYFDSIDREAKCSWCDNYSNIKTIEGLQSFHHHGVGFAIAEKLENNSHLTTYRLRYDIDVGETHKNFLIRTTEDSDHYLILSNDIEQSIRDVMGEE